LKTTAAQYTIRNIVQQGDFPVFAVMAAPLSQVQSVETRISKSKP